MKRSAGSAPKATPGEPCTSIVGVPVVPLELVSQRFYHMDVCLCPLPGGELLCHAPAFSAASYGRLREEAGRDKLIEVGAENAAGFAANAVAIGNTVIMSSCSDDLRARMAELKRRSGQFGFADMLERLERALSWPARMRMRVVYAWKKHRAELLLNLFLPVAIVLFVGIYLLSGGAAKFQSLTSESAGKDLSASAVERAVKLSAEKYCSASIMLSKSVEITHDFEIKEDA